MIKVTETSDGTFVVSQNEMWVAGVYDSAEAAKKAPQLSGYEIETLLGPIYLADRMNVPISLKDLNKAIVDVAELRLNNYNGSFVEHNGE